MKGKTNNPHGRPKNVPNRTTNELRNTLQCLFENNISQIQKDIDELEPKERLNILLKLASFCLPTLQSVGRENMLNNESTIEWVEIKSYEVDSKINIPILSFDPLSD